MRLLGLEVGTREIRAVRADRRLGVTRLTAIERIAVEGPASVPAALARLVVHRPLEVRTVLPAHAVTHRTLVLPFRDRRRLARTVPLELLGQLPLDPPDATVAFTSLGMVEGGTVVLAAAARAADVAEHAALLAAGGLPPARIDLGPLPAWNLLPATLGDAALLHADGAWSSVSVRRDGRLAGLRALGAAAADPHALAAEVHWSLKALGGMPPTLVTAGPGADAALSAALAASVPAAIVPFAEAATPLAGVRPEDLSACAVAAGLVVGARRGESALTLHRAAGPGPTALRPAATLAALALALAVFDWGLVRHRLVRRDAALAAAVRREAADALPGARLLAPRAELEAAVEALRRRPARPGGEASSLAVLRELSARLPPSLRLDLDELAVEAGRLSIHGRAESFDAVDALRRALGASPLLGDVETDQTRTTVDGGQVEFRLRAARRGEGASS